jgi:hypothetical protein
MKNLARCLVFGTTVLVTSGLLDTASGEERPGAVSQQQNSPTPSKELTVAPQAQPTQAEAPGTHRGPANICQDLVAFLQPKPPAPGPQSAASSAGGAVPQASGQSAPIPQTQSAPQPAMITVEEATAFAGANDLRACQEAAQRMRRAGVALPPGLIALAALKPELLTSSQP